MTQPDKQKQPTYENDNPHNEVKPENDYKYITEIEAPKPSTATPSVPAEMPPG